MSVTLRLRDRELTVSNTIFAVSQHLRLLVAGPVTEADSERVIVRITDWQLHPTCRWCRRAV